MGLMALGYGFRLGHCKSRPEGLWVGFGFKRPILGAVGNGRGVTNSICYGHPGAARPGHYQFSTGKSKLFLFLGYLVLLHLNHGPNS